jgi:hypothetical protein
MEQEHSELINPSKANDLRESALPQKPTSYRIAAK